MVDLDITTLIARAVVLLVAFTVHELAHAVTADYLGDPTARQLGRVTLNPLAHLDPFGTIALLLLGFGWAKPVPVNPNNFRGNPRTSMAVVALAGPLTNVMMALLFALPIRLGWYDYSIFSAVGVLPSAPMLFSTFIFINIILAVFNMIPLPPLDGFKVLMGILPLEIAYQLRPIEQYGSLILLLAIFVLPTLGLDVISDIIFASSGAILRFMVG